MSLVSEQFFDRSMQEEFALLEQLEGCEQNLIGEVAVLLNGTNQLDDNNPTGCQLDQLIMIDELIDDTGGQTFVAQTVPEANAEEKTLERAQLDNSSPLAISDCQELNDENVIGLRVEATTVVNNLEELNKIIADNQNLFTELHVLDGVVYLLADDQKLENFDASKSQIVKDATFVAAAADANAVATDDRDNDRDDQHDNNNNNNNNDNSSDGVFVATTDNKDDDDDDDDEYTIDGEEICPTEWEKGRKRQNKRRWKESNKPFLCIERGCDKSFATCYSLKAHLKVHSDEKPFKCRKENCDKSFKCSGDLVKHVRTHTGERPFKCPFDGCGRSFTTSNIRKVHVRTHTGERPFKCKQPKCGKAFASLTNYKNHARIHSGEKPYICVVADCGRRFTEYSSLYKHHLIHKEQKPYACDKCDRQYRQNSTLALHKKTAHCGSSDGSVTAAGGKRTRRGKRLTAAEVQKNLDQEARILQILLESSTEMMSSNSTKENDLQMFNYLEDDSESLLSSDEPSQLISMEALSEFDRNPIDVALDDLSKKHMSVSDLKWINRL